jgi:molybdate transport system substrate-binding protein
MTRLGRLLVVPITLVALVGAACGSSSSSVRTATTTSAAATTVPAPKGSITVFAAASLSESFKAVGDAFMAANPGVKVTFTFDGSSALVSQITQGAPADAFASADTANMDKLTAASLNGAAPVAFATNLLQIITPPGNPKGITGLADLAGDDLKVVLCDVSVPCGRYARQSLDLAKVTLTPVSLEQNVKGVVTKVTAGEADAGIVYATDIRSAGARAAGVAIPKDQNVLATYPIAATKASKNPDAVAAFIAFLTGADGQAILATYGFGTP